MSYISFDRAAQIYDTTRGHPAEVSQVIASSIRAILPSKGILLEIGIGTGRISRPLLAAGVQVFGLDVSRQMMERLLEQLPEGGLRPGLVLADASRQPLASGSFDAVLAVHVFHLIGEWKQALEEIRRVLRPDGSLLIGYDWSQPGSAWERINNYWHTLIAPYRQEAAGRGAGQFDINQVHESLRAMGAHRDERAIAGWVGEVTPGEILKNIGSGFYSSSWTLPQQILLEKTGELREWILDEIGPLDHAVKNERKFMLQRFRWG